MLKNETRAYARIAASLAVVGFISVASCAFVYWLRLREQGISRDSSDWGTFGDFVGGVAGTIIALATLIALAITLHLQANELAATRAELASSNRHLSAQSYALSKQNFESTFFRVVELIESRVAAMEYKERRGRSAFYEMLRDLTASNQAVFEGLESSVDEVRDAYGTWYRHNIPETFAPYFQLVLQALLLAHRHEAIKKPQAYAEILRATMSPTELCLLFYHGISGITDPKLYRMLTRFRFFDTPALLMSPNRRAWYEHQNSPGAPTLVQ